MPMARAALKVVIREVVRRNRVEERPRLPAGDARGRAARPSLPAEGHAAGARGDGEERAARQRATALAAEGVGVITLPDNRWERVDIKSVGLLPNAHRQGEGEGGGRARGLVRRPRRLRDRGRLDDRVDRHQGRHLVTRPNGTGILPGITRITATEVARREGLKVEERKFTVAEAKAAREAFITAASTIVMPVVRIDGEPVANGHPGSIATQLRAAFHDVAEKLR